MTSPAKLAPLNVLHQRNRAAVHISAHGLSLAGHVQIMER